MRYVERNAARAGLVERAEEWPWCSASGAAFVPSIPLADWPLPRPRGWREFVNGQESSVELDFIRACTRRNEPIGDVSDAVETAAEAPERLAATATSSEGDD